MKPPPFRLLRTDHRRRGRRRCSSSTPTRSRGCWPAGRASCPLMNFRLAQPGHLVDLRRVAGLDTHPAIDGDDPRDRRDGPPGRGGARPEVALGAPLLAEALRLRRAPADPQQRHRRRQHRARRPGRRAARRRAGDGRRDDRRRPATGERRIPAAEFFQRPVHHRARRRRDPHRGAASRTGGGGHAFVEFARTHGNFALVGRRGARRRRGRPDRLRRDRGQRRRAHARCGCPRPSRRSSGPAPSGAAVAAAVDAGLRRPAPGRRPAGAARPPASTSPGPACDAASSGRWPARRTGGEAP